MGRQRYKFYFKGGVKVGGGWNHNSKSVKFLAMLLLPESMNDYYHEEFLNSAVKYNLAVRNDTGITDTSVVPMLQECGLDTRSLDEYQTDLPYVKVYSSVMRPGRGNQFLSFYVQLGSHRPRKTVTIRPFGAEPSNYLFHAEGRLLTKKEALALLDPMKPGHHFIQNQSYKQYTKTVLREMVQVHTEKERLLSTARRIIRAPHKRVGGQR